MEMAEFAQLCEAFRAFHAEFALVFGRKQWRQRSGEYLQGLLVQAQERRNAENLAEVVPASPRVLQRFLTEAGWDDGAVIEQLQKENRELKLYLATLLHLLVAKGVLKPEEVETTVQAIEKN